MMTLLAVVALAGCAGGGTIPARQATAVVQAPQGTRAAADAAASADPGENPMGLPGENPMGLPGENPMGLPGENPMGLPGENPMGLPGAAFACTGLPGTGTAACTIAINTNVAPTANPAQPTSLIAGLQPADLQSAYGLSPGTAGGTVAIIDAYDNPAAESDLAVYRAAFGLPECTSANGCFRKANQRGDAGSPPASNAGWSLEIGLDVDMVSAACPRCSIVLVEADSASLDDLGAAVDTAARLGATAISNSYYAIEWSGETAEDVHFRHAGIAITASSGDRGYASYPAASQYVTSVGGTSLSRGGNGWSETGWKYAGHGCSKYVSRPWFQARLHCNTRSAVDVATVADPQTGVATFSTAGGGWYVAGGTSVGAPLIAAAYAQSGRLTGPGYSYQRWQSFHTIDGSGYHQLTGIGSPNGVAGL